MRYENDFGMRNEWKMGDFIQFKLTFNLDFMMQR